MYPEMVGDGSSSGSPFFFSGGNSWRSIHLCRSALLLCAVSSSPPHVCFLSLSLSLALYLYINIYHFLLVLSILLSFYSSHSPSQLNPSVHSILCFIRYSSLTIFCFSYSTAPICVHRAASVECCNTSLLCVLYPHIVYMYTYMYGCM